MYTTATFTRLDRNANGAASMVFTYTGDAGEQAVEFSYPVDASQMPTADYSRSLAMARLAILNNNRSFIVGATPFVGTVLDTTTPLPTPTPAVPFGAFCATSAAFTPGAAPNDVFTIFGSATKLVRIARMALSTTQTTAGNNRWAISKRSTANSGGTSAVVPAVPTDSTFPAATAVVRSYTVTPSSGSLVGSIWSARVPSPTAALSTASLGPDIFDPNGRYLATLNGAAQSLGWDFGGLALPPGLLVCATVWWNES